MIAQKYRISGIVSDNNSNPISYANVVVLNLVDSSVESGTITDEKGLYTIENLMPNDYKLKVSFLGYKTEIISFSLSENKNFNITLNEEKEVLGEVSIIARRPTLIKETDRLIFNIESTSLTEGNIWDVIRSTPGVLMINDEVLVKKSSSIIYLINGKRVNLTGTDLQQLLSGSSANSVKSVEVITNPPAKYDAEGDAVINIIMSKNLITGYNGNLFANYTKGIYPRYAAGTSHFFKSKKINLFLGYSFNDMKVNRINEEEINFIENNNEIGSWETEIDRNTTSQNHNANLNFDYFFNDKNTFSISGNASITPYWKRSTNSFTQAVDSTFSSFNKTEDDKMNIALNADYVYESQKGSRLSFNLHHTNYDYDRSQDVNTNYLNQNNDFLRSNSFSTSSNQNIKIYSGQTDMNIPIKENGSFELGFKASNIDSKSDISQLLTNNNTEILDLTNSGIFDYTEKNIAGYLSLSKEWHKWDLTLGVRTEYTKATGDLESVNIESNNFDYLKWFPNGNITRKFNENNSLGLSYSKRIERPTYSDLNPFQFYLNDNAFVAGNPNLLPSITETLTLTYNLNNSFTFEVYYRKSDNPFSELSFQDNESKQIKYIASNLKQNIDYGFDFSTYTQVVKNWTTYAVTSIFKDEAQFFDIENNNSLETNEQWSFYANWINYFSFLTDKSLSADVSILYISPIIDGSKEVSSRAQLDFGLKKSFNNGKWILSFRASDILLTSDFTVSNNFNSQNNKNYAKFDNQWVRLGLRHKFGNTKLQTNEGVKELEERDRIGND
jgi:hypothetical protein